MNTPKKHLIPHSKKSKKLASVALAGALALSGTACKDKGRNDIDPVIKTDHETKYTIPANKPKHAILDPFRKEVTIPEDFPEKDLIAFFKKGNVNDKDGNAKIVDITIEEDNIIISLEGTDGKTGKIKKTTETRKLIKTKIPELTITPPNFQNNITIGKSINLLENIQPEDTKIKTVKIGDEIVEVTDPHNFSPEFPWEYTITYTCIDPEKNKEITTSTKICINAKESAPKITMEKYIFQNEQDLDINNGIYKSPRAAASERFGDHNIQVLAIDLMNSSENLFKNISSQEVKERMKNTIPVSFEEAPTKDNFDGEIFNWEDSRNFDTNTPITKTSNGEDHTNLVINQGFGRYDNHKSGFENPERSTRAEDYGTAGKLFEYAQKNAGHKGVLCYDSNDNDTQIDKIKEQPNKNFIAFFTYSVDDVTDEQLKNDKSLQEFIKRYTELSKLPNVIAVVSATVNDNSHDYITVWENEETGPGKYKIFPTSTKGIFGANASGSNPTRISDAMYSCTKEVQCFLGRSPVGDSTSEATGDVAGLIRSIRNTFPQLNKEKLHKLLLNEKNNVPVQTTEWEPSGEYCLDMNKIVNNQLLPNGVPSSISYKNWKIELFPDNEWLKDKAIFVQGDLAKFDEQKRIWYLDPKAFAEKGWFTNPDGSLKNSIETEIEINLPKAWTKEKYLFQKKYTIRVNR